jgi:hypothetical protein
LDVLEKNAKRSFSASLKKDPFCPCALDYCPFGVCNKYYLLCPDYGGINDPTLSFIVTL